MTKPPDSCAIGVMPELRAFRADPRFHGFVTRFGLMEYFQQYGPPDDCELKNNKLTCH